MAAESERLIAASHLADWRAALARFGEVDASFLPEYHLAYALRVPGSQPWLWTFGRGADFFAYAFLLTPVRIGEEDTGYRDLSGIYGYTGPLSTTDGPAFLGAAWQAFDRHAREQRAVAEFVRFSPVHRNERWAHTGMTVSVNRQLAACTLPGTDEAWLAALDGKTRNMIRKAERGGLVGEELPLPDHLSAFRRLYEDTMTRNGALPFFWYDDAYWHELLALAPRGLRLFAALRSGEPVAASMAVVNGGNALYHLGAGRPEAMKLGAGNLSLFAMSCGLQRSGVKFVNMTGGRTTDAADPLLLFKRSNANGFVPFHIGRRVLDPVAYNELASAWARLHGTQPDPAKVLFWRA